MTKWRRIRGKLKVIISDEGEKYIESKPIARILLRVLKAVMDVLRAKDVIIEVPLKKFKLGYVPEPKSEEASVTPDSTSHSVSDTSPDFVVIKNPQNVSHRIFRVLFISLILLGIISIVIGMELSSIWKFSEKTKAYIGLMPPLGVGLIIVAFSSLAGYVMNSLSPMKGD